jgi:hypothetical protein
LAAVQTERAGRPRAWLLRAGREGQSEIVSM